MIPIKELCMPPPEKGSCRESGELGIRSRGEETDNHQLLLMKWDEDVTSRRNVIAALLRHEPTAFKKVWHDNLFILREFSLQQVTCESGGNESQILQPIICETSKIYCSKKILH
jgi:hypothetical protein